MEAPKRGISDEPTESFMEHLKLREGFRENVYPDKLGKLTAGTGHLLTAEEKAIYKEGDRISPEITSQWLKQDSSLAYSQALDQAKELGVDDQGMIEALGSVNFQMGGNWKSKFPGVWKGLQSGDWESAAQNVQWINPSTQQSESDWHRQTPKRTGDFMKAIRQYGEGQKKSIDPSGIAMEAMSKIDKPLGY